MSVFLLGAMTTGAAVIGLFFLRFWRDTRDALFLYFSVAFWLLAANWLALAFVDRDEPQTALYTLRLVAFGLIITGIWNKNRRQPAPTPADT